MGDQTEVKGFSFYRSYFEAAKDLPSKEEQADFLMAVCSFVFDGKDPDIHGVASAMFKLAKPNLETSIKRAKAGSKTSKDEQNGNEQESNDNQNGNKMESNDNQTIIKMETINDKGDMINDLKIDDLKINDKREKPIRHQYGQYNNVLLSDNELTELKSEFPNDWREWIERVSGYCRQYGKSYKDYLATIRNWARRDSKQTKVGYNPHAKNDVQTGYEDAMILLGGEDDRQ